MGVSERLELGDDVVLLGVGAFVSGGGVLFLHGKLSGNFCYKLFTSSSESLPSGSGLISGATICGMSLQRELI